MPKYDITVDLVGEDGNAWAIVARVRKALKQHGLTDTEIDAYATEAFSGDYNHVLQTTMAWVHVPPTTLTEDLANALKDLLFMWEVVNTIWEHDIHPDEAASELMQEAPAAAQAALDRYNKKGES